MLWIKKEVIDFIISDGLKENPIEACGYLAGNDQIIVKAVKMKNIDNSSEHFSFDIKEQFKVVKELRAQGLDIIGIYHTHTQTSARMSEEDKRLANDTNLIYLIFSLKDDNFKCYKVTEQKSVIAVTIEVI